MNSCVRVCLEGEDLKRNLKVSDEDIIMLGRIFSSALRDSLF